MNKVVRLFSIASLVGFFGAAHLMASTPDMSMQFTVMASLNGANIYAATLEGLGGQDLDVVDYAQREVLRYTQLTARLAQYASEKNIEIISLSQAVSDMTILQTAQMVLSVQKLNNLRNADLNRAYLAMSLKLNTFLLNTLQIGIARIGDTEEGRYLSNLIPQVQEGLNTVTRLSKKKMIEDLE